MFDEDADLRALLSILDPKARDGLRRVLIRDQVDRDAIAWLTASWIAFLLSVVFGVAHLLALTGQLSRAPKEPDIYGPGPRVFSLIQIALFLLGVLLAGAYLLLALGQEVIVPPVAPGT